MIITRACIIAIAMIEPTLDCFSIHAIFQQISSNALTFFVFTQRIIRARIRGRGGGLIVVTIDGIGIGIRIVLIVGRKGMRGSL
jgi:hypothetical protein